MSSTCESTDLSSFFVWNRSEFICFISSKIACRFSSSSFCLSTWEKAMEIESKQIKTVRYGFKFLIFIKVGFFHIRREYQMENQCRRLNQFFCTPAQFLSAIVLRK